MEESGNIQSREGYVLLASAMCILLNHSQGLWIYEERKDFSELCRYHLSMRRNVIGNDDESCWHLGTA